MLIFFVILVLVLSSCTNIDSDSKTLSLAHTQLDQANLVLDRATAILDLVSECAAGDIDQD